MINLFIYEYVAFCKDIIKAVLLTRGINFTGAIVCTSYLSVFSDLKKNTATFTKRWRKTHSIAPLIVKPIIIYRLTIVKVQNLKFTHLR